MDEHREETVRAICTLYQEAPGLAERGEQTVSTDELTGVQALERKHPGLPLAPHKVERREFEYVRHGTRSFILSRDVATGKLLASSSGPSRTEADFLAHLQAVVATNLKASRWHIVCDQLNTHQSEALVCWLAQLSGIDIDLGVKGKSGILASMASRAAFCIHRLLQSDHGSAFQVDVSRESVDSLKKRSPHLLHALRCARMRDLNRAPVA
jgi:DDE superfamily endonuclease